MINLIDIHKSYKKTHLEIPVLKSITMTLHEGELLALMGRSGSGKTTLIHILSGLLSADYGHYSFYGKNISTMTPKQRDAFRKKNIGIILQDYGLLHSLTAEENILLPVKYANGKKTFSKKRVYEISQRLEISHCLKKKIHELSGGESQRVSIARALIKNPRFILADEPTGSLDESTEIEVIKILRELAQEGHTVLVATHSHFVAQNCYRTLYLHDGKIQEAT